MRDVAANVIQLVNSLAPVQEPRRAQLERPRKAVSVSVQANLTEKLPDKSPGLPLTFEAKYHLRYGLCRYQIKEYLDRIPAGSDLFYPVREPKHTTALLQRYFSGGGRTLEGRHPFNEGCRARPWLKSRRVEFDPIDVVNVHAVWRPWILRRHVAENLPLGFGLPLLARRE